MPRRTPDANFKGSGSVGKDPVIHAQKQAAECWPSRPVTCGAGFGATRDVREHGHFAAPSRLHPWDVLFVLEDRALRRAPDLQHFWRALDLGRTLIALDRDFLNVRRFPLVESPGVIVGLAPDERGLRRVLRGVDRMLLRADTPSDLSLRGRAIEATLDTARDVRRADD